MSVKSTLLHGARSSINAAQDALHQVEDDFLYEIALLDEAKDRIQAVIDELKDDTDPPSPIVV